MNVISVSQAIGYLRELIENDLSLADVWISGEVSGPRIQQSGHAYFTLKDASAQLRAVMFRGNLQRQRGVSEHLSQGSQVIVHGRLTLYEARGDLQIVVDFVQPEGIGLRQAQFERLRLQLEEEGLFDPGRKRPLPPVPKRIGVATSAAGAVFHDISNILSRRWPLAELVLAPTPVQGPNAVAGVVAAIEMLNALGDIDVIIVARGGGSVEELWTFNEEPVARAVFGSLTPVVSAVGHETDFTICDYVADLRAPTPSAAAELITPDQAQVSAQIAARISGLAGMIDRGVLRSLEGVKALVERAARSVIDVGQQRQRLDGLERLATNSILHLQQTRGEAIRRALAQLAALNPQATLDRGYAVVHKADAVVSNIGQVSTGDAIVVKVSDGGFSARVQTPGTRRKRNNTPLPAATKPEPAPSIQPLLLP